MLKAQEPPRSHSLQRLVQELDVCGEQLTLAPELLELLAALHGELRARLV